MRSRRGKRLAVIPTLITASLLLMSLAALNTTTALAANPFEKFKECPTSFPGVEYCMYGVTTSGETAIGKTKVPIEKPIIQQAGLVPTGEGGVYYLIPATNGESLSKTEQNVPGGLTDIVNCKEIKGEGIFEKIERASCEAIFENKLTGVTATTELVANEHNPAILNNNALFQEKGAAITLPVRVHLKNPLLGESCYVGSETNPINLHLSTEPPKGKIGEIQEEAEDSILVLKDISLADTTFTVPVAEGCGGFFSFLIDPLVDSKLGLPSTTNNVALLNGTQALASREAVINHGE